MHSLIVDWSDNRDKHILEKLRMFAKNKQCCNRTFELQDETKFRISDRKQHSVKKNLILAEVCVNLGIRLDPLDKKYSPYCAIGEENCKESWKGKKLNTVIAIVRKDKLSSTVRIDEM